jgi:hypothetical protein
MAAEAAVLPDMAEGAAAVPFALTPAAAHQDVLNYTSREHTRLYEAAIAPCQFQNFDFRTVHPRRKTVMGHIRQQFIPPECERIPVQMEHDEGDPEDSLRSTLDTVYVYHFNIENQIRYLLAKEDIFSDTSNLVINPVNPFGKYTSPDNRYDEKTRQAWSVTQIHA